MKLITSVDALDEIYGTPANVAVWKEIDYINDHYRRFIDESPFLILSTFGDKGVDCSPRGDPKGFVRVQDPKTILIPDRKGNKRSDSLRNIIQNPQIGLIFLVPNISESLRVSGTAEICIDETLCQSFSINGKPAASVLKVTIEKTYYQCQKAISRSKIWDATTYIDRTSFPTASQLAEAFVPKSVS